MKNEYTITMWTDVDGNIMFDVYDLNVVEHDDGIPDALDGGICTGTILDTLNMVGEIIVKNENK